MQAVRAGHTTSHTCLVPYSLFLEGHLNLSAMQAIISKIQARSGVRVRIGEATQRIQKGWVMNLHLDLGPLSGAWEAASVLTATENYTEQTW